jgi:hypothetical protein
MDNLEGYLLSVGKYTKNKHGSNLAILLSRRGSHRKQILPLLSTFEVASLELYINQRIERPWSDLIICHCKVLLEEQKGVSSHLCDFQNALASVLNSILTEQSGWILPAVYEVNTELFNLSSAVDSQLLAAKEKADNLEKAARTMNKAFSCCATDRYSSVEESRKWGVYRMVNLMFKIYFKVFIIDLAIIYKSVW